MAWESSSTKNGRRIGLLPLITRGQIICGIGILRLVKSSLMKALPMTNKHYQN